MGSINAFPKSKIDRTYEIEANHLCNCQYCNKNAVCRICSTGNDLQRAHIIARRLIEYIGSSSKWNREEWMAYDGKNTFILCRNHHRAYDNGKLTPKEMEIIKPIINEILDQFLVEVVETMTDINKPHEIVLKNFEAFFKKLKKI